MSAKMNKSLFLPIILQLALVALVSSQSSSSTTRRESQGVKYLRQFGEKWKALLPEDSNDHLANLKFLKNLNCSEHFVSLEVKLCESFKILDLSAECPTNSVAFSFGPIYSLDQLRKQIDYTLRREWMHLETGYFALDQYKRYAEFFAQKCFKPIYEDYKKFNQTDYSHESEFVDMFKDCKVPKVENENVKRADVSSLACYAELLRPTVSNVVTTTNGMVRIAKVMRKYGAGARMIEDYNTRKFRSRLDYHCKRNGNSSAKLAAKFYRSIMLRDEYFDSVPQDDKYFDRVKKALVCEAIADNSDVIAYYIGNRKISLLAHF